MTTETPKTGIKNADELITLATAFGLTVTVETTDRETLTSYVVRFAIPVPVAYADTELGRAIAGDTLTTLWTKPTRKGARGRLEDATVWSTTDSRKVRTLRDVTAAVETLGHSSNKYARDAAPLPDDVVDAPHAVFVDGRQVHAGISAAHIRTVVKNRRFRGWTFHQDAENAICIESRRYVPVPAAEETPAPTADDRQHVRITNDGPAETIPTREALDEINAAMMQPEVKRTVKRMSASNSTAHIVYRDGRTVYLRPATPGDTFPTPSERPTDAELTGDIDAEIAAYYAETFQAVADGSALPVRADMIRPGMDVIHAHMGETRTVSAITAFVGPGAPWVRPTWTFRSHDESTTGSTFPPDMHLMVTRTSLDTVLGSALAPAAPVIRPAAEEPQRTGTVATVCSCGADAVAPIGGSRPACTHDGETRRNGGVVVGGRVVRRADRGTCYTDRHVVHNVDRWESGNYVARCAECVAADLGVTADALPGAATEERTADADRIRTAQALARLDRV